MKNTPTCEKLARDLAVAQQLVESVNNGHLTPHEAATQSRILTQLAHILEAEHHIRTLQQQNEDLARLAAMETALRESEERYRTLVENANDIIYTHDLAGNFTSVNAAAARTYGYTTEEIVRLNIRDIIAPDYLPIALASIQSKLTGADRTDPYELQTRTRDGVPVWVEVSTVLIRHEGRPFGIQGVARDITERHRAEEALQQSEAHLRAIFDGSDQAFLLLDPAYQIIAFNPQADQIARRRYHIGLTLGTSLLDLTPLPIIDLFKRTFAAALAGTIQVFEQQLADRGAGIEWWEITLNPVISAEGKRTGVLLIVRDIAERKRSEEALQHSEANLRAIFDSSDQSIMLIAPDFSLLAFNKTAQLVARFLVKTDMHVGDSILRYITPADHAAFQEHFAETLLGKSQVVERLVHGLGHETIWWEFSYNPIMLANGTVTGVSMLGRNITNHKRAEATLQESEERYRQLVECSPIAIAIHRDSSFLYINPACQKLFGVTHSADLVGRPIHDFVHPDYREIALRRARQVQHESIEAPLLEEKFVQLNGTVKDVEDICIPFVYQGQPAVQSVFYDVTARNQALAELRHSEERFAKAFRASPDILIITRSADGVIIDVNDSWDKLLGYTRKESIGHNPGDLNLWVDRRVPAQLGHLLQQHKAVRDFDVALRRKSGEMCELVISVDMVEIGGELCMLTIARDMTERKQAEQQLRLQSAALSAAANAIVITDRNGAITWVNPAYTQMTGYAAEETIGQNIRQVEADTLDTMFPQAMWESLDEGRVWQGEVPARRKDGSTYTQEQTITPVLDEQRRISHFIAIKQDITERKQHEQHLSYLVNHDALTGLPNRLWLEQALEGAAARSRRGTQSALLLLDLDNFKLVNDTLGHAVGDDLLAVLTQVLSRCLREGDVLARLGGDEFAMLLEGSSLPQAIILAEQMRLLVDATPFRFGEQSFTLSISIGVVPVDGYQTAQQLLAQADMAMYTAKDQGRNQIALYHPEDSSTRRLSEANQWVSRIKDALRENRLVLHYQPVVRLSDGHVAHYEALLRMKGTDGELILPNNFISAAERFGLMPPLDHWVVRQAIQTLQEHPDISIVINLSGRSRVDEYLLDFIETKLREHQVRPERLGFEITETAAVQDLVRAEGWIRRLKALGCRFALDDFGVGFTSFSYLRTLPVDQIKIDGSFIRTIDQDSSNRDIVHAMYSLAHKLGKETVAEFVESESILQVLKEIGITYGQGFYLGKPLPDLP